jgi:DNA-binding NarL/FixJ family response regulator
MKPARVLLADDHPEVAKALTKILSKEFELVGVVQDGLSLLTSAETLKPDVIVADISMPRLDGFKALAKLKSKDPNVKLIFISMYQESTLASVALEAGAVGFVLKHSAQDELIPAVRAALKGKTYFSSSL